MENILYIKNWDGILELFIILFVAFLIGYVFGSRKKKIIIEKKVRPQELQDIETIFTEIKPEILKIIENHKNATAETTIEVPRAVQVEGLNFDSIGRAQESDKDDLTLITGIGPFVEEKLNKIGIYTYKQISNLKKQDIETITRLIDYFPGRMERDDWVGQAKNLI